MKKLQNNFTTPEQSKRLLELGVPADSADMYYTRTNPIPKVYIEGTTRHAYHTTCWSVGRLIEIMKICNHPDDVDEVFCELAYSKKNLVELIVRLMEENKEITDFSKLEE
jgi:hypothetical protein